MREGHKAFEHRSVAVDRVPCGIRVVGAGEARLTLAVIAHAHGLEDRGGADFCQRGIERRTIRRGGEGGRVAAKVGDEIFFDQPVLRDFECAATGAYRDMARQEADSVDGDILKFKGDDIA